MGVGDIGNGNVYQKQTKGTRTWYAGSQNNTTVKDVSKSYLALLYNITSQGRRTGNRPTAKTLCLYPIWLQLSIHPPCLNIPSKYHPMIVHTTWAIPYQYNHATLSNIATPETTSLIIPKYPATI
jgi:hypothetical protein